MKDELAVVTGGASGIGFACAARLVEAGATVVIADRDEEAGQAAASRLSAHFIAIDVASESSIEEAARQIEAEVGAVSMLVTSAGILQPPLGPHELPVEVWDRVVDINFRGSYLTCRAFGRGMVERRRGSVVMVSSITGLLSTPLLAYGPTKAAIISLTQSLATRWGRTGIRVNCISPGITATPALANAVSRGERDVDVFLNATPLGRLLEPREIANTACFLLSREASAITGANIVVDGGWVAAGTWHTYGGIPGDLP